ncbi:MAG: hypothetical protein CMH30_09155 [Micavibrio sp.]|nr:hypothetical protein [Micavibrio sp.]|tara:strand:+ start:756 stop:1541 length:786 start_codon:yes stop_codon:yes gene_type:complete
MIQKLFYSLCFIILATTAHAADAKKAQFHYSVYAGGFYVMDAVLDLDIESKNYDINLTAKTHGALNKLVPWEGDFTTAGLVQKEKFQPLEHTSSAIWKGDKESKHFFYNKDGSFNRFEEFEKGTTTQHKIDKEVANHSIDILTATLDMMVQQGCANNNAVFDGKRRFDLSFKSKREDYQIANKYNIYEGPVEICTVEITPTGGRWSEKPRGWLNIQEQGRQKGALPELHMAKISPNLPAIPVKAKIVTQYGTFMLHLTDAK